MRTISEAEFHILRVLYDSPYAHEKAELAWQIVNEYYMGDRNVRPESEYLTAVDACICSGWVFRMTRELQERRKERLKKELLPTVECDLEVGVGAFELTESGYRLFCDTAALRRLPYLFGYRLFPEELRVECIGATLEIAISYQYKHRYMLFTTNQTNIECQFVSVGTPQKIGAWRLNRFEVLESGYSILSQYEPEQKPTCSTDQD